MSTHCDLRQFALSKWVEEQYQSELNSGAPLVLRPLGGDAGFRRYFRFQEPSQWLAVDAPPSTEDSRLFVQLANLLRGADVNTPQIKAVDFESGWLLVEDFGDRLLISTAESERHSQTNFYASSFESLLRLQQCAPTIHLPIYDTTLLTKELEIFCEWFVAKLLNHSLSIVETHLIQKMFSALVSSALEQPRVLVHRDYHSRNLICIDSNALGVIDFQGAVWGPCTYDLVSLLRDCYLRWPAEQVNDWALNYRELAIKKGLLSNQISADAYIQWFDWMGLQRHIKVLGIFARLHLRDNKPHYLKDLPLVIRYLLEVCDKYPQFTDFKRLFKEVLLPIAERQAWYQPWGNAGDRKHVGDRK